MGKLSSEATRIRGRKGQVLRSRRLARTKGLCEHCLKEGVVALATVVNHKTPLAHGGEDTDENTENLCSKCDEIVTAEQFGRLVKTQTGVDGWPV